MRNSQDVRHLLKKIKKLEVSILFNAYVIVAMSLLFVYSATINKSRMFFIKEIIWVGLGTLVFIAFSMFDYKNYSKYSKIIYYINIVMLISVYIFGSKILGATRWIRLGFFNFQPSEFAKILIVLTFAELLSNSFKKGVRGWYGIFRTGVHFIVPFLLVLKQPDLGTSLVFLMIYMVLIFLHEVDLAPYFTMVFAGISLMPVAYMFLKDYQKKRILTFLNPEADVLGSGWNVIQSMIAVGSGGLIGKGIFNGTQNKLKFLPESHTDFIFAVLSEELGFIGSAFLIFMYLWLVLNVINIGRKSEDVYGQLIAYGIAVIIFFHTVVNMGMVIGIMPVTGLPLLLMSYGGSSYIFTFMMLGIVQSIKINGN